MARKPGSTPQAMRNRAAKTAAAMTSPAAATAQAQPKKKVTPAQFAKEVRVEALVSRRGVANAAPGDLTGSVGPIVPGNTRVALTIDTVRP